MSAFKMACTPAPPAVNISLLLFPKRRTNPTPIIINISLYSFFIYFAPVVMLLILATNCGSPCRIMPSNTIIIKPVSTGLLLGMDEYTVITTIAVSIQPVTLITGVFIFYHFPAIALITVGNLPLTAK